MSNDDSDFARPQHTDPLGKCTTRVDVPCSDRLKGWE